ncbi:hypothetical protein MRX96_022851 [Rhipicephalus microplus]
MRRAENSTSTPIAATRGAQKRWPHEDPAASAPYLSLAPVESPFDVASNSRGPLDLAFERMPVEQPLVKTGRTWPHTASCHRFSTRPEAPGCNIVRSKGGGPA